MRAVGNFNHCRAFFGCIIFLTGPIIPENQSHFQHSIRWTQTSDDKIRFRKKALEVSQNSRSCQSAAEKIFPWQTKVRSQIDNSKAAHCAETPWPKLSHLACQAINDASN